MQTLKFYLIFFLSFFLESRSYIDYESPFHPVVGTEGMVVSQNYLSSEIGVEILNFGVKPIGQSGEIIQAVNLNYILNKISFVD